MYGEVLSSLAPIIAVFPSDERLTELPKPSPKSSSNAKSIACSVHVEPERVNTYAAP